MNTVMRALAVGMLAVGAIASVPQPAQAGKGGAFVGGMLAGHVATRLIQNSNRQTRAAEYRAYSQPRSSSAGSVEDRLERLERLAANGVITREEYQQRRQAIIDGL